MTSIEKIEDTPTRKEDSAKFTERIPIECQVVAVLVMVPIVDECGSTCGKKILLTQVPSEDHSKFEERATDSGHDSGEYPDRRKAVQLKMIAPNSFNLISGLTDGNPPEVTAAIEILEELFGLLNKDEISSRAPLLKDRLIRKENAPEFMGYQVRGLSLSRMNWPSTTILPFLEVEVAHNSSAVKIKVSLSDEDSGIDAAPSLNQGPFLEFDQVQIFKFVLGNVFTIELTAAEWEEIQAVLQKEGRTWKLIDEEVIATEIEQLESEDMSLRKIAWIILQFLADSHT